MAELPSPADFARIRQGWDANTCLMQYPGRGNMIVMHIIPVGPDRTFETYDFFFETAEPGEAKREAIDIGLVESVQGDMGTPAFIRGRIVRDPNGSGKSGNAVHYFHRLVLDAYARAAA